MLGIPGILHDRAAFVGPVNTRTYSGYSLSGSGQKKLEYGSLSEPGRSATGDQLEPFQCHHMASGSLAEAVIFLLSSGAAVMVSTALVRKSDRWTPRCWIDLAPRAKNANTQGWRTGK
jgi:hypothetical protein